MSLAWLAAVRPLGNQYAELPYDLSLGLEQSHPLCQALTSCMLTGCEPSAFTQYALMTSSPTGVSSPPAVLSWAGVPTTVVNPYRPLITSSKSGSFGDCGIDWRNPARLTVRAGAVASSECTVRVPLCTRPSVATNVTATSSEAPGASAAGKPTDGGAVKAAVASTALTLPAPPERFWTRRVPESFTVSGPQQAAMVEMLLKNIRSDDGW